MSKNELGSQSSPYLLQHKDNPVHWKPWGDAAFSRALETGKPILLSIGYAACHWCHVMAHESFEDQKCADEMNARFINIKVDREEHPDVDAIYQKALTIMGQPGGWPLTMFLTQTGQPFWGGTYFPNTAAYGRPSFVEVLHSISDIYENQKENVVKNVDAIGTALLEETQPKGDGDLNLTTINQSISFIHQNFDTINGGLKGAPKFPQPVLLDFLWRSGWLNEDQALQELINLSLEKMCLGGIYDHIGGGFARYSTDEEWLAPHFEKMLYDNALLISLLSTVWRKYPNPLFKRTVAESIDWALKEMKIETPNGFALAAALDADSEGVEGKFYVWDESEIDTHLGEDSNHFKEAYDITQAGNWEGHNIARRVTGFASLKEEDALIDQRKILYDIRKKRIAPGRDDKILTDWNALMIKALCEAGLVFGRADWIETAKDIYENLCDVMTTKGELHHSWCNGQLGPKAYLEDYANLCSASLALFEVSGIDTYLNNAKDWVDDLNTQFWDNKVGGYNFSKSQTVKGLAIQPKPIHDNATPSGNGTMANVLCDLYHISAEPEYKERFNQLVNIFASSNPNEIFATPGLCSALQRFEKMEIIAIIGPTDEKPTNALISKASRYPSPNRKILLGDGKTAFRSPHALAGKTMKADKATAYVCQVGTCSKPLNTVIGLEEHLSSIPI